MFECSLADLQQDEDQAYRKIRLRAEDVQGKNVLTNFWVWCFFNASRLFDFFVLVSLSLAASFFLAGYGFYDRQAKVSS